MHQELLILSNIKKSYRVLNLMFKSGKYYGCISDKEVIKDTNGHGQKLQ